MPRHALTSLVVAFASCAGAPTHDTSPAPAATSLLGGPLYPTALEPARREKLERDLADARVRYDAEPEDEDAVIWYGRRLAYLMRYDEAIEVYTTGLALHPESSRLLRHRGHRFISTRRFADAERDLERASALIAGQPDTIEPDGAPNALGIPTSSRHSNIWYHLGLALYLQGQFEKALRAYEACLATAPTDDMRVATLHWLYMTLRRLGQDEEADRAVAKIDDDMDVIENHAYYALVKMYAGLLSPEELVGAEKDGIQAASSAYGLGNWYLYEGDSERAFGIFEEILAGDAWPAFGYIAAEAEVARVRKRD